MDIFAIDIGGTKIALGVIRNNKLIESITLPTPEVLSIESFTNEILTAKPEWIKSASKIGISTTGYVCAEGITAINPDTLNFPQPFPLQHVIENITKKPTFIINDAQAAAWYEYKQQSSGSSMAYITISTGVGGGFVINNKLIQGKTGLAGHLGHSVITDHTLCGCGQIGCVEALASGTAIAKQASQHITPNIANFELFKLAQYNTQANDIIEQSALAIATLCTNLKVMLDLDYIVIGGGVGLATGYLDRVEQHIKNKPRVFQIDLIPAVGKQHTCLLGAAYFADSVDEDASRC